MRRRISNVSAFCLFFSACLSAAEIKGKVVDPSGAPVAGAQVSVVSRVGVEAQTASSISGAFELNIPETPGAKLVVTAPGFSTQTLPLEPDSFRAARDCAANRFRARGRFRHRCSRE
jgi:hypothetical protein